MKTNPLLLSLLLIASHGFATETSSTESRETSADVKPHPLSKYIYQEGLGYSLNVKPYKWQSTPPKGFNDWITNDLNQTNCAQLTGGTNQTWNAMGGVYQSVMPGQRRTELWRPLDEEDRHRPFLANFSVIPSMSGRADDTFGWALKDTEGKVRFQILFKPNLNDPRHTLEVWQCDQNGKETKTSDVINYRDVYTVSLNYKSDTQTYTGSIRNLKSDTSFNITEKAGGGTSSTKGSTSYPFGAVAAVWTLNGKDSGDNFMSFSDHAPSDGKQSGLNSASFSEDIKSPNTIPNDITHPVPVSY